MLFFFFFKQKTAYEMRISDWSSDVCSSDLSHLILLHVSIVSADISSACQPEIAAYDGQQQRSGEHQHPSAPRRGGWSVCSGRALLNRGSRLLLPCGAIGFSHAAPPSRSEEHTSELQSLMRISYAVFCLKKTQTLY